MTGPTVTLAFALTAALAACTAGLEEPLGDPAETGLDLRIAEEVPSAESALDQIRVPAGDGTSALDDELIGGEGDTGGSCWVTLQWCRHPQTGWPMCTATPSCTYQQVFENCLDLIIRTC